MVGIGASALWHRRHDTWARLTLALALGATAWWAYTLLDRTPTWMPWLRAVVLAAGLGSAVVLVALRHPGRSAVLVAGVGIAAALAAPPPTPSTPPPPPTPGPSPPPAPRPPSGRAAPWLGGLPERAGLSPGRGARAPRSGGAEPVYRAAPRGPHPARRERDDSPRRRHSGAARRPDSRAPVTPGRQRAGSGRARRWRAWTWWRPGWARRGRLPLHQHAGTRAWCRSSRRMRRATPGSPPA